MLFIATILLPNIPTRNVIVTFCFICLLKSGKFSFNIRIDLLPDQKLKLIVLVVCLELRKNTRILAKNIISFHSKHKICITNLLKSAVSRVMMKCQEFRFTKIFLGIEWALHWIGVLLQAIPVWFHNFTQFVMHMIEETFELVSSTFSYFAVAHFFSIKL